MDSAIEKLELGLQRLAKAGDDPDLLGLALQSIHGALEDQFRARLAAEPSMPADQREAVLDPKRVQWKDLLDGMQLYADLGAQDRELIWRTNGQRARVAHGGRYSGSRAELEHYATLVQRLCGYTAPAKPAKSAAAPAKPAAAPERQAKPAGAARSARPSAPADAPEIPRAVRARPPAPPRERSRVSWWGMIIAVALLVGLASFVVLRSATRPLSQLAAAPLPTSPLADEPTEAAPTTAPTSPAAPRFATVSAPEGLFLRESPGESARSLGLLSNGTPLAVVGGPVADPQHTWWQVETTGGARQRGWCAGEFLTLEPTP
jgi:hypothetical protein